jgi:hypothetical protein
MKEYLINRIIIALKKCCGNRYIFEYNQKNNRVEEYIGSNGYYWESWSFISNHILYLL